MAATNGRGGARPGAGRKPIPPDDVARIRRMIQVPGNSKRSIAKHLGYDRKTIRNYTNTARSDDDEE